MDAGLNAKHETVSSGGDTTSKSFIGFAVDEEAVAPPPRKLEPPNPDEPNILWNPVKLKKDAMHMKF